MKATIFTFGILCCMLLLVTGCSLLSSGGGLSIISPYQGKEGITAAFLNNAPRAEQYEGNDLFVSVKLENKGAASVQNGILVLGTDNGYMHSFDAERTTFSLKGKRETKIWTGEQMSEFFTGKLAELSTYQEQHESTVSIKLCYPYYSLVQTDICIDTDVFGLYGKRKACSAKELTFKDQGAPVAITKIENEIIPMKDNKVKLMMKIYYTNLGSGRVVSQESYATFCDSTKVPKSTDFGILAAEVQLSGATIQCIGTPEILADNQGSLTCTSEPMQAVPPYKTALKVQLNYGYVLVEKKSFTIYALPE